MNRSNSHDSLDSTVLECDIPILETQPDESILKAHLSKAARQFRASVQADHLSTEKLVSILYDINPFNVDTFIELAAKYDMVVSTTLKGWNGIDTKLCVKLLHITCEWNSDRVRLPGRSDYVSLRGKIKPTLSMIDNVILSYYQALWLHYERCFTGNVSYITTIEKMKNKKA